MVFLEAMAGVSPQDRFTDSQLYNVLYQELLVAAFPASPAKHTPRVLTDMLVALEHLVVCAQTPRSFLVFAWWLLIQNWARLRFSDHGSILPSSVKTRRVFQHSSPGQRPWARTAQSPLDRSSSIAVAVWPSPGGCRKGGACSKTWQTTRGTTSSLFPSSNGHGCRRRELSYDTASAMQNRVLRRVRLGDEPLFCVPPPHDSGRRTPTGPSCPVQPHSWGLRSL